MSTPRSVSVALLWHMHQPWYGDPRSDRLRLPWTRLHALKDYLDMIAAVRRHPKLRVTFNLVPSLLAQLQGYVDGSHSDEALVTARQDTAWLEEPQRRWWLRHGFHVHWPRLVEPVPRYRELLERRGRSPGAVSEADLLRRFGTAELRDLMVLFHLAWCGQELRREDPVVGELLVKGRDYTEDDKQGLLDRLDVALAGVLPRYAEAAADGQIELATSPYYHPIMPLLCHFPDVKAAMPGVSIPAGARDIPEDAAEQLRRGRALCEELLGIAPVGLWPSEGSVSTPALELAAAAGFQWAASDEQILALSLHHGRPSGMPPSARVQPHRHAGLAMFFRDHRLSDNIGFEYADWEPGAAAADFLRGCESAAAAGAGLERPVVSVILDGENCWEHYADNGGPFLDRLYRGLVEHPTLQAATFSEHLATAGEPPALEWLFPGSWINHDFYIWAGHHDDQRAWEQLFLARGRLVDAQDRLDEATRRQAWEHLYIAEGSDWFWWYGDDHSSAEDDVFDDLFRAHLRRVHELCGLTPPAALDLPIPGVAARPALVPPAARFTPVLDGRETSFFEWRPAGRLGGAGPAGAMSRGAGDRLLRRVRYGFDSTSAYLAVELDLPRSADDEAALWSLVIETAAAGRVSRLAVPAPHVPGRHRLKLEDGPRRAASADVVIDSLLELRAPLRALPAAVGESLALSVTVSRDGQVADRWPADGAFDVPLPDEAARLCDWMV